MALSKYIVLAASIVLAELLRRWYKAFMFAFTGPLSKVPGPKLNKLSTIPHIISMARGTSYLYMYDLHKKYGDIVRLEPNTVIVSDKDLVDKILIEWDLPKATLIYKMVNNVEPGGISVLTERDKEKHKHRRRLLSHGFSVSYLKAVEPLMISCINVMKEVMDKACQDGGGSAILDMYAIISGLTFDVMSAASFGGSFDEVRHLDSPPNSVKSLVVRQLNLLTLHAAIPIAKYLPWFIPPVRVPELESQLNAIVARRRALDKNIVKKDLLQIFLNANEEDPNSFSETDIRSEMKFFTTAGSDTSSTTITFALQYLLDNPDTLKALTKEVDAALPSPSDPITADITRNIAYVNAVIYETLRLMPPTAAGMQRETHEPIQLGEYFIPAGTQITADHYTLQRTATIFPNPNTFQPSRWLPSTSNNSSTTTSSSITDKLAAMYAFSVGTRSCIGRQFAMMEMRLLLTTLVRGYDLRRVDGQSAEAVNMLVLHFKDARYLVDVRKRG